MQKLSCLSSIIISDIVKKCLNVLIILIIFSVIGAFLEPSSLFEEIYQKSKLFAKSTLNPESSDLIHEKYAPFIDNFAIVSSRLQTSKILRESFSTVNFKSLNPIVNSTWETLSYTRKPSPYISVFALLPLRSPPLFS